MVKMLLELMEVPGLMQDAQKFVTTQVSAGLKHFGSQGSDAILKELQQLIILKVMTGCLPSDLTPQQKLSHYST
jgi:hypothetical protein